MSKVAMFTQRADELQEQAQARGEEVYGTKPWYCSTALIENGASIAFIGANPGGGPQDRSYDHQEGVLRKPYEKDRQYNAWLDDIHWGNNLRRPTDLQNNVKYAFRVLFGEQGESILRNAACFNVVPIRSRNVSKLSQQTWTAGVAWCLDVADHVSPKVIICLGNGNTRSAWSVFAKRWMDTGMGEIEKQQVYGTFHLKHGRITVGTLANTLVIGLPHLSRMKNVHALQKTAESMKLTPLIYKHL